MSAVKRLYDRAVAALGLYRGELPADGAAPIQRVQVICVTTGGRLAEVPFMQHYGFGSRPHAGCDYALLALSGDPTKSVIVASNDQRFQIGLVEGESVLFDDLGQVVHLTRTGIVARDQYGNSFVTNENGIVQTDKSGSAISMLEGGITLSPENGIVTVNGKVVATGSGGVGMDVTGSFGATGDVVAGVGGTNIGLLNLKVSGVTPGSGDSGPPVPGT